MHYNETQQKQILREMEKNLMALLSVDLITNDYEVIYSDEAYKSYENGYHRKQFFEAWQKHGIPLVCSQDRERMAYELSRDYLIDQLNRNGEFNTICQFLVNNEPKYCRVKIAKNGFEKDNILISIRNIDKELLNDREHMAQVEDLHQKQIQHENELHQMEETLKQMRMKNFISQMHPHFLYNALSSIREIVLTDPEYGADMLYDFTTHLRASIRAMSTDEMICFSQELENIKAYVSIEKMRFGELLNVIYDIGTIDFKIIPLSIQPIVENAIKHGIYEKGNEGGTVYLKTRESDNYWEISIEDNGVGFEPEIIKREVEAGKRDSTGLFNLIFRLQNMMNATIDIDSKIGKGTRVYIHIPKSKKLKILASEGKSVS